MLEKWILAMVVLLTFFHPELTESSLFCRDEKTCGKSCLNKDKAAKTQIKRVYKNTTAIIPCPHLEADEELLFVSLYKEETELHSADMKNTSDNSEGMFMVFKQNNSVSYMMKETQSNNTGIYNCTIQTQIRINSSTTILLIKDVEEPTEQPIHCSTLILYIIGGVIIIFNLIITVIAFVLGYKLKNKEPPENTYMNTRPAGFRRR